LPISVVRQIFSCMSFNACLINNIQSIFISQLQILCNWWIVRSPYRINIELLQYFKVFPNGSFIHSVPQIWMLHVRVYTVYFDGLAIEVENLIADFSFFKTNTTRNYFFGFSFIVY